MKVLVAEKIADEGIEKLRAEGYDVDVIDGRREEDLIATIPGYDALIVCSDAPATEAVMEAGRNLKVIGRAGIGLGNVDVRSATEHGIIVCNAPTSIVMSAAEQTFALILAVTRHIPQANAAMHEGRWEHARFVGSELYGKTLAIFGLGRIGALVADRAHAFEMEVIAYDPYCPPERAQQLGVTLCGTVEEACATADIITAHLPKTAETVRMFGAEQYALMKDGVYLINNACGDIFDLDAMVPFLENGHIAGLGLDVYEPEPCTASPVHRFENVILTPHIGASTYEARNRAGVQIAQYVTDGLRGRMVPTAVNVAPVPAETIDTVGPYIPACETLGHIIAQMADADFTALDLCVYGDLATQDVTVLATAALGGIFSEEGDPANLVNAAYIAEQRGMTINISGSPLSPDYSSMADLTARMGKDEIEIACTVSGNSLQTRIVSIDGYKLDFVPGSNFMVLVYEDRPGRLGQIGTIMGDAGINIETLELSDAKKNGKTDNRALVAFNVDGPVPDEIKERLGRAVDLAEGYFIDL